MSRPIVAFLLPTWLTVACGEAGKAPDTERASDLDTEFDTDAEPDTDSDIDALLDGRAVFRYATFGDEALWTGRLQLNEVMQTVSPATAIGLGLKVDADLVPLEVLASADLDDPATTAALLRLDAVVGIRAHVDGKGTITSLGVTCALCHSTVNDAVAPGIGQRLDGHPNRTLDAGLIISLSRHFDDKNDLRTQLQSWGPGRYDPYWNHDGISLPVLIPPAYGLRDVALETYTGEGPISYWNAYVAVTQMGGKGTFVSEELGIDVHDDPDLVTPMLPALRQYQFTLEPPPADPADYDAGAAAYGSVVFNGAGRCATCHAGPSFSDTPTLHDPAEVGQDPAYANRGTTGRYRTTPLRGVASHPPFFHDGSAATLEEVVQHYDAHFALGLSAPQQVFLVAYLESL